MREIKYLVVHCADTPDDREVTAEEVHRWHRNNLWDGIGYHALIRRDGTVELGRPTYWQGAHVRGYNDESLGVCLAGRHEFSAAQYRALAEWLAARLDENPSAVVVGHRDLDGLKTCPNFDVQGWWESIRPYWGGR